MLSFVICDDNQVTLNRLSKMLDTIMLEHNLDGQIVFTTTSSSETLEYVKNNLTNVVILDIDLKDTTSGLKIAEIIRKQDKNIYIIFITGHLEFGLVAYKYKTFDYIAKPLTLERLEETIIRLFDDISGSNDKYIRLNNNKTIIPENNIKFIQKDGMKLIFHTDTRDYITYNSFNKIQDHLPKQFIRCHKSYIVNVNKITAVDPSKNMISFSNADKCYIGPKYKNNFMEVFNYGNFSNNFNGNHNTE